MPKKIVYLTESDKQWMTPTIKHLIDKRWEAYRLQNWSVYNSLKIKVRNLITKAKIALFKKKKDTVKGLWSYVNLERGTVNKDLNALFDGSSTSDVLNQLNDHFCKSMTVSLSSRNCNLEDDNWLPSVTVLDVWRMLSRLQPKAAGSDDVPIRTAVQEECYRFG